MSISAPEILCKQPSERRLYSMEFASLIDSNSGEQLSTVSSIVSSKIGSTGVSDLIISNSGITDGLATNSLVTMFLESGTHRHFYKVTVQVVTNAGQILEGDGIINIKDE